MSRAVSLETKAAGIKLVLFDVDGVLTDGRVLVHSDGTESKHFSIRDGIAMVWAQRAGIRVGLLSARNSPTTLYRAQQLGVGLVHQGVSSKLATYSQILAELGLGDESVAYMGDDLMDLGVLLRAGLPVAPSDAHPEVRRRVPFVTRAAGGRGAVREVIDAVARAQGRWREMTGWFTGAKG